MFHLLAALLRLVPKSSIGTCPEFFSGCFVSGPRYAGFAVCYAQAKFNIDRVLRHKSESLQDDSCWIMFVAYSSRRLGISFAIADENPVAETIVREYCDPICLHCSVRAFAIGCNTASPTNDQVVMNTRNKCIICMRNEAFD